MRPRHNGRHFADDIFKSIYENGNFLFSNKLPMKCVPWGLIVIMAGRRTGNKPLSKLIHWRILGMHHLASLSYTITNWSWTWADVGRHLSPLQWRHNERDGVSNNRHLDCLLDRLFKRRSKKTVNLRVTGLCEGNSPVTGRFPSQRASKVENVFICVIKPTWPQSMEIHVNQRRFMPLPTDVYISIGKLGHGQFR